MSNKRSDKLVDCLIKEIELSKISIQQAYQNLLSRSKINWIDHVYLKSFAYARDLNHLHELKPEIVSLVEARFMPPTLENIRGTCILYNYEQFTSKTLGKQRSPHLLYKMLAKEVIYPLRPAFNFGTQPSKEQIIRICNNRFRFLILFVKKYKKALVTAQKATKYEKCNDLAQLLTYFSDWARPNKCLGDKIIMELVYRFNPKTKKATTAPPILMVKQPKTKLRNLTLKDMERYQ